MEARILTTKQVEVVEHFKELADCQTFIGTVSTDDGTCEVVLLGENWVWSLIIETDGIHHASEASVGEWSMGVEA